MNYQSRAEAITARIARTGQPLLVFFLGDSVRAMLATDPGAARVPPNAVIGLYDSKCPPEWLESDITYAAAQG